MLIEVKKVKIAVMVPTSYTEKLRKVLWDNNIGCIGNYNKCTTYTKCVSSFSPNDKAHPFIGKKNEVSIVKEDKLEFVCNIEDVLDIISLVKKNHPYEEVGYDIYPLIDIEDIK